MRRFLHGALIVPLLAACETGPPTVDHEAVETVEWINATATPLTAVAPATSRSDLTAFTAMVGSAHLIGLGEATHGSREFFTMKDRTFRFLVDDFIFSWCTLPQIEPVRI